MILRRFYSCWAIFSIAVFFIIFIIPMCILVPFRQLHRAALKINYAWALGFFKLAFIPIKKEWRFKLDKKQQYIICANHFSYTDIPTLALFPRTFKFVGKSSLGRIPLFGYMYNRLHITVNRANYRSRAQSLVKAREEIKKGFNLGFFPEGGIRLKNYPNMVEFKDGAFILAVENNIPIIPVTLPDNYHILRDDEIMDMYPRKCRIIYHKPIWPEGKTDTDMKKLKENVFRVIQTELIKGSSTIDL